MWKAGLLFLVTAFFLLKGFVQYYSITTMSSPDTEPPGPLDHSELISVLTELYTLLDTLSATLPVTAELPPSHTGLWPLEDFDANSAHEAGFSEEAVRVLSMIPYPAFEQELEPRTTACNYLGSLPDWDRQRVLIYGLDDYLAPPSAIKLTDGQGGEGCVYVYDAETRLMHPWVSLKMGPGVDDEEKRDMSLNYFRAYIPSTSPREALQPLINKFRSLDYINVPSWAGMDHQLVYEEWAFPPPVRTDFSDDEDFQSQARARDEFLAKRQLKDLYLECGWDVNAVAQTAFRCDEFLEKRRQHLDTIYRDRLEGNERLQAMRLSGTRGMQ